jgi:ribonuclease G
MNRLAITRITKSGKEHIAYILMDEKRSFLSFQLFEPEGTSLLNRIAVARVEDIVTGIHAAFVRISSTQNCYLPLEEEQELIYTKKYSKKPGLHCGDEVLVQVVRDAVKSKDPVVSSKLTLQGKVCVLTSKNRALSVSKKLGATQRSHYQKLLSSISWGDEERNFGLIIRTEAACYEDSYILEDINALTAQYRQLLHNAMHRSLYSVLYEDPPAYLSRLKSERLSEVDLIVTDQPDIYETIARQLPAHKDMLSLYTDEAVSLSTLYHIYGGLDTLLSKRVWMPSGANIIIEQLETLTFIDVNTAKNSGAKSAAILSVNMEAAYEIARQLRLRNISGMILIYFINMKSKEEEKTLIDHLKKLLAADSVPCNFIDITKLGLVELTRKKIHKSLKEIC